MIVTGSNSWLHHGCHTCMPLHMSVSFMMLRLSCVKYAQPTLVDHTCNDTVSSLTNEQLFSACSLSSWLTLDNQSVCSPISQTNSALNHLSQIQFCRPIERATKCGLSFAFKWPLDRSWMEPLGFVLKEGGIQAPVTGPHLQTSHIPGSRVFLVQSGYAGFYTGNWTSR